MRTLSLSLCAVLLSVSLQGAPFQVSRPGNIVSAPYLRYGGKAARNDAGVQLVVWSDTRPDDVAVTFNFRSIRGALVDAYSRDVDFEIAPAAAAGHPAIFGYESDVEVATDGDDFLVAYNRWSQPERPKAKITHFAVVSSDRRVEAAPAVVPGVLLSMTAALGHYFVATVDPSLETVQLTILNRDGRIVRTGLPVTPREKPGARLAALHALRDGRLLVLWNGVRSTTLDVALVEPYLLFQRDYNGLVSTTRIVQLEATSGIAEGNDRLLIVGKNTANKTTLTSAAVNKDGALLLREDYEDWGNEWTRQFAVAATINGFAALADDVFFSWTGRSAAVLRFSAEGRRTGVFQPIGEPLENVAPFSGEEGRTVFVTTGPHFRPAVELTDVTFGGWLRTAVSRSLPAQEQATAAQCRGVTTIAWKEVSAEESLVRFRRFGPDGAPLDPPDRGVAIPVGRQSRPAVTCGRRTTLVSWREEPARETEQYRGLLLFDSGESFDLGVLALGYNSKVVWDGASYVVLSHRYDFGPTPPQLTRWSDDGRWLGARQLPELTGRVHLTFALASNGESLLLTWVEPLEKQETVLYAQPLSRSLALIGAPVQLTDRMPSHQQVYTLAVTASPQGWLAGWRRRVNEGCAAFTFRLGRDGSPFDPRGGVLTNAPSPECDALQLGWNGAEYEVLTEEALVARGTDGSIALRAAADPGEHLAAVTFGIRRLLVSSFVEPAPAVRLLYAEPIP